MAAYKTWSELLLELDRQTDRHSQYDKLEISIFTPLHISLRPLCMFHFPLNKKQKALK